MTARTRLWLLAAFAVATLVAPFLVRDFYVSLFNMIGIYSLVALGLILLIGWTGLLSFGQAAFFGLGAYATAWLTTAHGYSPWAGLVFGLAVTVATALVLGAISLRLSGHYLSLATLSWGVGLALLFGNLQMLGRQNGIANIPAIPVPGGAITDVRGIYLLIWICVGLSLAASMSLMWSRQGRAARILKDGIVLGESFGINAFAVRLSVFVLASIPAALAGWLYAHTLRYVSPTPFGLMSGVEFLLMTTVGGTNSVLGPLFGSTVLVLLRDLVQDILPYFTNYGATLESVVFGVLFILLLHYASRGIADLISVRPDVGGDGSLPSDLPRRTMPPKDSPILRVDHVTRRFGGLVAVDDVSFELRAGEILGLIGPNGAGKSTTFNLVTGLLPLSGGKVLVRDLDVDRAGPRGLLRAGVVRTFQHVKVNPQMTVLENTMVGAYGRTHRGFLAGLLGISRAEERQARQEALHQLRRVGLADKAGEAAGSLSLGQQRLLEVARALTADPVLLMLDEPAAGLRYQEKQALAQLLGDLRVDGVSVLLVEHDMSFLMELVDRVVVLNFGRKLAEGRPDEIRANPDVIEAYLGTEE